MHDYRHPELARQLLGCRKMVGVCMGVDEIPDAQPIARGERDIAVNLTELRVDERGRAGRLAADDIRPTAARGHRFEFNKMPPLRPMPRR
jgi:hypothetical protein